MKNIITLLTVLLLFNCSNKDHDIMHSYIATKNVNGLEYEIKSFKIEDVGHEYTKSNIKMLDENIVKADRHNESVYGEYAPMSTTFYKIERDSLIDALKRPNPQVRYIVEVTSEGKEFTLYFIYNTITKKF